MTEKQNETECRIADCLKQLGLHAEAEQWDQDLDAVKRSTRIEILVMGEFNHGKSSLINMLVGKNILRVAMTPTTQVETTIGFGATEDRVRICDLEGNVKTVPLSEYDEQKIGDARRVGIELTSTCFDPDVLFVDTPGLNEAHAMRETLVRELMNRASLILYLLDASQPATRQESRQIEMSLCGVPTHKRVIVVNKCDRLDDEELLEVCAYIEKTLWPTFQGETFHFVSAKKKDYAGNQKLIRRIGTVAAEARKSVAREAAERLVNNMISRLRIWKWVAMAFEQMDLMVLRKMPSIRCEKGQNSGVEARVARIDKFIEETEKSVLAASQVFEASFRRAVVREIEKVSVDDAEDYLDGFVASEFRTWMMEKKAEIAAGISGLCAEIVSDVCAFDSAWIAEMSRYLAKSFRLSSVESRICECMALENIPHINHEFIPFDKIVRLSKLPKTRLENVQRRAQTCIEQWAENVRHAVSQDLGQARTDMMSLLVQDDGAITRQIHDLAENMVALRKMGKSFELDLQGISVHEGNVS